MGFVVRRVTRADIRTFIGIDIATEYCVGEPVGYAACRDGRIVAAGSVTWDHWGRVWGWFNRSETLSPVILHRRAMRMLDLLRMAGEPAIYAMCSPEIPGSEKWLHRLGFVIDETLTHPWGPIYRCDLST